MRRVSWTSTMPLVALALLAWIAPAHLEGQTPPPPITQEEYELLEWEEDLPMAELLPLDGSWTGLKQWLGEPTSEECETDPNLGHVSCEVSWDGIDARFFDDGSRWYTMRFEVEGPQYTLRMDGVEIGIGTSIHDLAPVLPVPYAERRERCLGGECLHRIEFGVYPSTFTVDFIYDPVTEEITRMQFQEYWS